MALNILIFDLMVGASTFVIARYPGSIAKSPIRFAMRYEHSSPDIPARMQIS